MNTLYVTAVEPVNRSSPFIVKDTLNGTFYIVRNPSINIMKCDTCYNPCEHELAVKLFLETDFSLIEQEFSKIDIE